MLEVLDPTDIVIHGGRVATLCIASQLLLAILEMRLSHGQVRTIVPRPGDEIAYQPTVLRVRARDDDLRVG